MIHLINYENKDFYKEILEQMFAQRKTMFIDKLGWDLSARNGQEIDEFDTQDTIYLVCIDEQGGAIRNSLRLNPTIKPHLMSEILSEYCAKGVPRGETIWEISRYCYNPNYMRRHDRFDAMKQMMCGVMECSILYGLKKLTFVQHTAISAHCLACGWDMRPLGLPQEDRGLLYAAFEVNVDINGLNAVRKNAGNTQPVLKIQPGVRRAA